MLEAFTWAAADLSVDVALISSCVVPVLRRWAKELCLPATDGSAPSASPNLLEMSEPSVTPAASAAARLVLAPFFALLDACSKRASSVVNLDCLRPRSSK